MTIKTGLTGNMGCGKSTVASIFKWLGVPVFEADTEARKLFNNVYVISELEKKFGESIIISNQIDRKLLASVVFKNQEYLNWLNNLIHPLVKLQFEQFVEINFSEPYLLFESAIIFESLFKDYFDKNIVVYAPSEIAMKRVLLRDNTTETDINNRLKNQLDISKKIILGDFIIYNDDTQLILPQILSVHSQLLIFSQNKH